MIQHWSMLQCAVPSQHVSGTMIFFEILKPYFHYQNLDDSRLILTLDGHLWQWSLVLSSQKWISLSKLSSYFNFKTQSIPTVFNGCYSLLHNSLDLNIRSLRNAWRPGLDTSSDGTCCSQSVLFTYDGSYTIKVHFRELISLQSVSPALSFIISQW